MIGMLISLLIIVIVLGVAWYVINLIPLPPPFQQIVHVIFIVIVAIILIWFLLGLAGHVPASMRW